MNRFKTWARRLLDNQVVREEWVASNLGALPAGARILDAGCGCQQYRKYCSHLDYVSQDFAHFEVDEKSSMAGRTEKYAYGKIDLVSDIWNIPAPDASFDAILCTEVFEHIPFPNEALKELGRLLKPGGVLLLTAPFACLRHMDPYFHYSGFSDRWYEFMLPRSGLNVESLTPVGNYYSWIMVEIARSWFTSRGASRLVSPFLLFPAFVFYYLKARHADRAARDTLCMGYHVIARRLPAS